MNLPIRPTLALLVLAVALAACGTTADATPSTAADPSTPAAPSAPASEQPDPAAEPDGTITVIPDVAVTGPGISVAEAIAAGDGEAIIDAYLVRTVEGDIFLCDELADGPSVACGSPMLEVIGMANDDATWDVANAETTGLLEADGVLYFEESYVYGTVEL
jgi:hypothetical protein